MSNPGASHPDLRFPLRNEGIWEVALVNKDEDSDTEPREIMSEPSDREDGESTETQRVDKRAFIRQLAKEADIPLCAAAQAYEAFIKVLFDNVRAGNQVNLTGFGKFYWQRHSGPQGAVRRRREARLHGGGELVVKPLHWESEAAQSVDLLELVAAGVEEPRRAGVLGH